MGLQRVGQDLAIEQQQNALKLGDGYPVDHGRLQAAGGAVGPLFAPSISPGRGCMHHGTHSGK